MAWPLGVSPVPLYPLLNGQAKQAQQLLKCSGKMTVMVQHNAQIHTSRTVKQRTTRWQEKGLIRFVCPRYSSALNLIEGEWH